jgi:drug/metabolite transporter (DMT)-like permease
MTTLNSRATLLLSLTMLCYASNHVIGRAVHTDLPPMGLSFWRWVCGALILFPLVAPRLKTLWPVYLEHWRVLALLGFLIVGSTTLVLFGLNFTTATNTSLINATQPTITALLCWLFLGDRLRGVQWLGIVIAFSGISWMLVRGDWQVLFGLDFNPGDLIVLLAMFGFAAYGINIRKIPAEFHVTESLFAIILLGLIPLIPFYLAESAIYRPFQVSTESVMVVVTLALLVSVLGMLMWTRGNQLIGPNRAAIYVNLLPLFGAMLAVLFLGESIRAYHIAGGVLIGSGMWLALRQETRSA